MTTKNDDAKTVLTGRCYCGEITFTTTQEPQTVAYCHCDSCRRATGGPVGAFAAMDETTVTFTPNDGRAISTNLAWIIHENTQFSLAHCTH